MLVRGGGGGGLRPGGGGGGGGRVCGGWVVLVLKGLEGVWWVDGASVVGGMVSKGIGQWGEWAVLVPEVASGVSSVVA